jgi:hypothetical protein
MKLKRNLVVATMAFLLCGAAMPPAPVPVAPKVSVRLTTPTGQKGAQALRTPLVVQNRIIILWRTDDGCFGWTNTVKHTTGTNCPVVPVTTMTLTIRPPCFGSLQSKTTGAWSDFVALTNQSAVTVSKVAQPMQLFRVKATGENLSLAWNSITNPIAGINIHYGTKSGVYTNMVAVGNTNAATIVITPGVTYFLAAAARTATGVEGVKSDEFKFTVPIPKLSIQ